MMLKCHRIHANAGANISPCESAREWIDKSAPAAYRCTPIPIANASGWKMSWPFEVEAEWNGGSHQNDLKVTVPERYKGQVDSHFGSGILTFHTGYIFRTDPGIATWVRGVPNTHKEGIFPLDGLVETYWLPFSFTMNWKMTKPGKIKFEKDEPFCFITLFPHAEIDKVEPIIEPMDEQFNKEFNAYMESRRDFIIGLRENNPEILKQKWQKHYFKGVTPLGPTSSFHLNKRKLNWFRENI